MTYAVGSLVRARGREWVVLPGSGDDLLLVRPLGGTDEEATGIYRPLEAVEPATFALPDPQRPGDFRAARLLRDAVRLGFRASAGPFRSFARLGVEPRPYQLVPLLMALKLDPVRLLIADDVGIGKTVEAGLIARELLDRGEIRRMAVLCPPSLAEQWQAELRDKFHIDATLVLPGTATALERTLGPTESIFDLHPYVIVSLDFIKSDRRRADFLRTCPELVIVDEAHTCASGSAGRGQHQRHDLISQLAATSRHLILVTATPHSGNDEAFRSLLRLLDPSFGDLPEDVSGAQHEDQRRRLAAHLVQRRRGDIRAYLDTDTPFPVRESGDDEQSYGLTPAYRALFEQALEYARESVTGPSGSRRHFRVQWWSALALLRSIASSPAAAAATLRTRAATADTETEEEADTIGRRTVLDQVDDEGAEGIDVAPGSDTADSEESKARRTLRALAAQAAAIQPGDDAKLQKAITIVKGLLKDGHHPIIFCRFIPTADYVKDALRAALPKDVTVEAVTGLLPPAERELRVNALGQAPKRVLVCTDCLSEGVNLQHHFSAVLHYDLSWNPTRHEQREGRVDRYGQPLPRVRMVTLFGADNQIDGIVLDVLLRKHKTIRSALGISVPAPLDTNEVIEAIFEGLLLRGKSAGPHYQPVMQGLEEHMAPRKRALFERWDRSAEREKRSRTIFAQETIKVDEVRQELAAAREAIGGAADVAGFTRDALRLQGVAVGGEGGRLEADLHGAEGLPLREALGPALGSPARIVGRFELPVRDGEEYLSRTHPLVEGLASYVLDSALDALGTGQARRCGVVRTRAVATRTTLLLLRLRYHIITLRGRDEYPLLAEDCRLVAFTGSPQTAVWLDDTAAVQALLTLTPDANVSPEAASGFLRPVIEGFDLLQAHLNAVALERGQELLAAHRRVRDAARMRGVSYRVEPQLPPDVLGVFVFLPAGP